MADKDDIHQRWLKAYEEAEAKIRSKYGYLWIFNPQYWRDHPPKHPNGPITEIFDTRQHGLHR